MNNETITLAGDNLDQARRIIGLERQVAALVERLDHDWPLAEESVDPGLPDFEEEE